MSRAKRVPSKRKKGRESRKSSKRKKGGWKTTRGIPHQTRKLAGELVKIAKEANCPLNRFVSIRPTPQILARGDRKAKQWLREKINHILQTVHGRHTIRQLYVPCITVFEKNVGGALHCHLLIHQSRGNHAIEGIADGKIIHVQRTRNHHIEYITKQRLPYSPEMETTTTHRRQASDPIVGVRVSVSKDARQLLKNYGEFQSKK